ncbi:hypothetical protein [Aeromonas caviae]|uniref:hypothetical protein n=1 Tax=Aeromonas caviae TaxID=648 RepID=UPI0015DC8ACC|nr:hypothetical protein [Aeromonas caviae]BBS17716.1 hypothetical protein WP5W18E02_27530 [Aeromonas caviae]
MKRFNCTLADKRGEFGECMEAHNTGRYVLFSDVEKLQRRMQEMLDKSNRTGVAIERAISTGAVPADHPLKSRLDLLANHHKHEQALADGMVAMADQCHLLASLLRELRDGVEGDWCFPGDLDERIDSALAVTLCVRLDAACTEAATTPTEQDYREPMAGQVPALVKVRTITESQEFELTAVLQSIANGFSDDPAHDAAAMLKRIAGEVPWTGDSFQLPSRQVGLPCNQQPSLAGQVFAGLSAATALSVLDANSAADVVQLMLEAAEAKGGEPCDSASPSSSPA